jgi:hypothetical protein
MSPRSIGLFVEGSEYTDLRGRKPLTELWNELCARVTIAPPMVYTFGITKAQIVALNETQKTPGSREALDIFIERMYQKHAFDVAIIAFDSIPRNQHIPHGCMRSEVNFILEHFVRRKHLSADWLGAARQLLQYYAQYPQCPRGPGRPPRVELDVVYMDPMFEALLMADDAAVLRAVGHTRRPKDWPKFDTMNQRPDSNILAHAVKFATDDVRRIIRGDMKTHKHDWALQIVRAAKADSKLFQHPIASRLRTLLT